ncbi:MAG: glycosyltransferase [Syntrophales bacterium]|nr:glycosyltransferase [Syntrophales bacterium]MDY0044656.1 glycosyltransferase [Syntrophales bacterium]
MKICMFTNTYIPHVGGVARSVDFFTHDLRALGHQVLIVAPVFANGNKNENEDEILRVPAIQNFNGSDFSVSINIPFIISSRINEFKPDVVHSHHPYLLGDAALRIARRRECPVIFTHHTLYEKYTHYVPLDSEAMKNFVIHLSSRYANLCDGVIAPSRSVADLIRKRGVAVPIRVIPTGVDQEFFARGRRDHFRKNYGITDHMPVIGHVGRLAPEKNLAFLAEAVALFFKDNPGKFLVVGGGSGKNVIPRIFEAYGISERLVMAGEKSGQELADAYKAMDIFVFASKTETQGMVLVEAMAAGKPVVALAASGTREVIKDRANGRLLRKNSTKEKFAKTLEEYFRDPNLKERWRQEALATSRRFSRASSAKKLIRFYESVLKKDLQKDALKHELFAWEKLQVALKTEWELITEKAGALADAVGQNKKTR